MDSSIRVEYWGKKKREFKAAGFLPLKVCDCALRCSGSLCEYVCLFVFVKKDRGHREGTLQQDE